MTGRNHLGNADELTSFKMAMKRQLMKHKKEKQSMRMWDFESVMLNNIPEIQKRIEKINKLNIRIKNDIFKDTIVADKKKINKQFVHIANYCLMGFLKS